MSGMLETATTWDDIELKKQLVTDAGQDGLLQVPVPVLFDPAERSGHRTHDLTDAVDGKIIGKGRASGGLIGRFGQVFQELVHFHFDQKPSGRRGINMNDRHSPYGLKCGLESILQGD